MKKNKAEEKEGETCLSYLYPLTPSGSFLGI